MRRNRVLIAAAAVLGSLTVFAVTLARADGRGSAATEDPLREVLASPAELQKVRKYRDDAVARAAAGDATIKALLLQQIDANLQAKAELRQGTMGFLLYPGELQRTVIDYEIWKYQSYVSSGVFPKRYFGYFDEAWDTREREAELKKTAHAAVELINLLQEKKKRPVRITDAEVAVTFIAEGGALLLREKQSELDNIHPVHGIGLDDIATGFKAYADVVKEVDAKTGTKLGAVVEWKEGEPFLTRYLTFKEGVAATAVMWLYEKELAQKKLEGRDGTKLSDLPLDEQFLYASLVYNSGLLFSAERIAMIKSYETADYLFDVSEQNARKRWRLPLFKPADARKKLIEERAYPEQPTSWSAVYHVLQRWGGYDGMMRFTDVFDEKGMFRAKVPVR